MFFLTKYNAEFAILYCALFGLQFPVFWASHIFRPEIYIIFFQSICLFILTKNKNPKTSFLLGLFSSIGIFAHLIVLWLPFVIAGLYFLPYFKDRGTLLSKYREFLSFAAGVIISLSLYYLLIDKGSLSGMVNFGLSQRKSLIHAFYTFSKMVGKYFIADGGWRIGILIISLTIIIKKLIKNPSKIFFEIAPFLFGLCSTFLLLTLIGRTSRLYLSFLNIWFLFFLVFSISLISNVRLQQLLKIMVFLFFAGYISLFAMATYKLDLNNYYNKLNNACELIDKNAKVLGRSQHHYYLQKKIQYIYESDLLPVVKESKTDILEKYYNKNHFDYIILDSALLNFKNDTTSTAGFLQRHAIKLATVVHPYGGRRIMDYPIFGGVIKFLYKYNKSSKKTDETMIYRINHQSFNNKI